jgi:hypothetical protein
MRITDLRSRRNRSTDIQPPSRNDSPATGIAAENTILVPLVAGLGYGFGFGAPERTGQTQVTVAVDPPRYSHSKPTAENGLAWQRMVGFWQHLSELNDGLASG